MNVSLKKFALLPLALLLALAALAYLPSIAYADPEVDTTTKLYDGSNNEITSAVTVEKGDSYTINSKTTYTYYYPPTRRDETFTSDSSVVYYSNASCTEGATSTKPTEIGTYYVRGEYAANFFNGGTLLKASQSPVITLTITEHTHTYGEPEYTWSSDNSKVTASRTCTKCSDKDTQEVSTEATVTQQADCTNPELTTYTATFTKAAFSTQTKNDVETKAALGHSVVHHDFLPSTCTEDGNKEYWSCSRCNKYFSDEACTTETTADDVKLAAKGHAPDAGTVTKEPTCTEVGEKTYTCIICRSVAKTEEIPALGHTLTKTDVLSATCTEDGHEAYWTCSKCQKMFSDEAGTTEISQPESVPAAGHKWDAGVVTKEPAVTEKGVKTYTCTVCGETKTEEIPATGGADKGDKGDGSNAGDDDKGNTGDKTDGNKGNNDSGNAGDGVNANDNKGGTTTTTVTTATTTQANAAADNNVTPKTGDSADLAVVLFSVLATLALVSGRIAYKKR